MKKGWKPKLLMTIPPKIWKMAGMTLPAPCYTSVVWVVNFLYFSAKYAVCKNMFK